jgi:hypothetical protein
MDESSEEYSMHKATVHAICQRGLLARAVFPAAVTAAGIIVAAAGHGFKAPGAISYGLFAAAFSSGMSAVFAWEMHQRNEELFRCLDEARRRHARPKA